MGVVDFSRKTNTNVETTGFQSVVFGANGALLEVELNEMQALVNERLRKFLKSMFGDCCSQDALYVIGNNVFLNGTFIIDGYLFTNSDPITVDISETNQLYLGYKIETITGADKVHKDGIGNEDEIDNTIIDTRVGIETSRREILSVKLVADGTSLPDDYNSFLLVDAGEPQIRSKNIDSIVTYCTEYVDKLVDSISTSIRNLTSKTDNLAEDVDYINSNLSEQLGNHTVKSDVPENAVFTDTVYDDTGVKESIEELDSNLGELAEGYYGKDITYPKISGHWSYSNGKFYNNVTDTRDNLQLAIQFYNSSGVYISQEFHDIFNVGVYNIEFETPSNTSFIRFKHNGKSKDINYTDNLCDVLPNTKYVAILNVSGTNPKVNSGIAFSMIIKKFISSVSSISESLDALRYGEVAGGKNLATVSSFSTKNNEIIFTKKDDSTLIANGSNYSEGAGVSNKFLAKAGITYTAQIITDLQLSMFIWNLDENTSVVSPTSSKEIHFSVTKDTNISIAIETNNVVFNNTEIKVQLEEGLVATEYEPYFPSNKMLAEENSQQSTEMMDIKMLGWSVPRECPIQNEVNGNQFIQKIGRADMSKLAWYTYSPTGIFRFASGIGTGYTKYNIKRGSFAYSRGYKYVGTSGSWADIGNYGNKTIMGVFAGGGDDGFILTNHSYTNSSDFKQAMQGQYLYYELATYNTMTIDGNEEVVKVAEGVDSLSKNTRVNLFNQTLKTATQNGVTCTNNGDGTYTLTGTATATTYFTFQGSKFNGIKKGCKLIGCPPNGSHSTYSLNYSAMINGKDQDLQDFGNGSEMSDDGSISMVSIEVINGATLNDVVFKPMITYYSDATYDDYIPYTGSTGTLCGDVSDIKKSLPTMDSPLPIHLGGTGYSYANNACNNFLDSLPVNTTNVDDSICIISEVSRDLSTGVRTYAKRTLSSFIKYFKDALKTYFRPFNGYYKESNGSGYAHLKISIGTPNDNCWNKPIELTFSRSGSPMIEKVWILLDLNYSNTKVIKSFYAFSLNPEDFTLKVQSDGTSIDLYIKLNGLSNIKLLDYSFSEDFVGLGSSLSAYNTEHGDIVATSPFMPSTLPVNPTDTSKLGMWIETN